MRRAADGFERNILVHGKCRLHINSSNAKSATSTRQQDSGAGFSGVDHHFNNASSNQAHLHAPLKVLGFVPAATAGGTYSFQLVASGNFGGDAHNCKLLVEVVPVS